MPTESGKLDPGDERKLAVSLFNRTWALLDKPDRSADEDNEMIHTTHASRHHWGVVGQAVHWARGEWQCSRVYAVLGRPEPAMYHARRCLALSTEHQLGPFDVGAAHEAIARSYQVAGDPAKTAEHVALARQEAAKITDDEDRAILDGDLAELAPPS